MRAGRNQHINQQSNSWPPSTNLPHEHTGQGIVMKKAAGKDLGPLSGSSSKPSFVASTAKRPPTRKEQITWRRRKTYMRQCSRRRETEALELQGKVKTYVRTQKLRSAHNTLNPLQSLNRRSWMRYALFRSGWPIQPALCAWHTILPPGKKPPQNRAQEQELLCWFVDVEDGEAENDALGPKRRVPLLLVGESSHRHRTRRPLSRVKRRIVSAWKGHSSSKARWWCRLAHHLGGEVLSKAK